MDALNYIRNAGKQVPTLGSIAFSATKPFFDLHMEEEHKNNLAEHAKIVNTYFLEHVYAH